MEWKQHPTNEKGTVQSN
uniref:Uncharacterized protein n=1 Tax=Rhizophora mucronata TaxID=61149 RepID=A0A2P2R3Y7_RHIMU